MFLTSDRSDASVRTHVGFCYQTVCVVSEGALLQAVAAAAGRTLILPAKPVHHVAGVSSVTTAQAEVGRTSYSHVTDGALEGQSFADSTLSPTSLTATVAAVYAKLCREHRHRMKRPVVPQSIRKVITIS